MRTPRAPHAWLANSLTPLPHEERYSSPDPITWGPWERRDQICQLGLNDTECLKLPMAAVVVRTPRAPHAWLANFLTHRPRKKRNSPQNRPWRAPGSAKYCRSSAIALVTAPPALATRRRASELSVRRVLRGRGGWLSSIDRRNSLFSFSAACDVGGKVGKTHRIACLTSRTS